MLVPRAPEGLKGAYGVGGYLWVWAMEDASGGMSL